MSYIIIFQNKISITSCWHNYTENDYYGMSERRANGPHLLGFTPLHSPPSFSMAWVWRLDCEKGIWKNASVHRKHCNSNNSVSAAGFVLMWYLSIMLPIQPKKRKVLMSEACHTINDLDNMWQEIRQPLEEKCWYESTYDSESTQTLNR